MSRPATGVLVYRARLDEPTGDDCLSAEERARASCFRASDAARRFAARRSFLRHVLARRLGEAPGRIGFTIDGRGRPGLASPWSSSGLVFSLSSAGDHARLAVTREFPVGVDIERERPDLDGLELARRFFHPEETRELLALPPDLVRRRFFVLWTAKEAVLKALGLGLPGGLHRILLECEPSLRILDGGGLIDAPTEWRLVPLEAPPSHAAALAVRSPAVRVREVDWDPGRA